MKIGIVICPQAVISGKSNGVRSQAITWKRGLEEYLGYQVQEINSWGCYDWSSFDIIHVFGSGIWLNDFVKSLSEKNQNIVISPIIDSIKSKRFYKIASFLALPKLRLVSNIYLLKKSLPYVKGVFVRSNYEAEFFTKSFGVNKRKVFLNELSYELEPPLTNLPKENFCLHISSIYQERKNVIRLIKAAKKYNFKLVLAGSKGNKEQFEPIKKEIGENENIQVLGFVSDDEMKSLFSRAKVFALPSIMEGVGIVALNAALYGCNIVMTNIGAPKEYYNNMAFLVNPYSVDSIGLGVEKALESNDKSLKKHIEKKYSLEVISKKLANHYKQITKSN